MKLVLALGIVALLSGCAGIGSDYDTPAQAGQIPYAVTPITPSVAQDFRVERPVAQPAPRGGPNRETYQYRIGPADVLSIFVDEPLFAEDANAVIGAGQTQQEARMYTVSERGEIFLPLHGPLAVSGLTVSEAYEAILRVLSEFFARPQINVSVMEYRSQQVTVVLGGSSGHYLPISNKPLTLIDAIMLTQSGATNPAGLDLRNTTLKRNGIDTSVDVAALMESSTFGSEWLLKDGDVVIVPENSNGVYLIGELPNQRRLIDPYSTTLAEVLFPPAAAAQQQGGQFQQQNNYLNQGAADIASVFVVRGDTTFANVYHLNATTPDAMLLAEQFPMQKGDIIFISTRGITRFNRFVAEFLPSLAPLLIASQFDN